MGRSLPFFFKWCAQKKSATNSLKDKNEKLLKCK
jgi:hypothetical protein